MEKYKTRYIQNKQNYLSVQKGGNTECSLNDKSLNGDCTESLTFSTDGVKIGENLYKLNFINYAPSGVIFRLNGTNFFIKILGRFGLKNEFEVEHLDLKKVDENKRLHDKYIEIIKLVPSLDSHVMKTCGYGKVKDEESFEVANKIEFQDRMTQYMSIHGGTINNRSTMTITCQFKEGVEYIIMTHPAKNIESAANIHVIEKIKNIDYDSLVTITKNFLEKIFTLSKIYLHLDLKIENMLLEINGNVVTNFILINLDNVIKFEDLEKIKKQDENLFEFQYPHPPKPLSTYMVRPPEYTKYTNNDPSLFTYKSNYIGILDIIIFFLTRGNMRYIDIVEDVIKYENFNSYNKLKILMDDWRHIGHLIQLFSLLCDDQYKNQNFYPGKIYKDTTEIQLKNNLDTFHLKNEQDLINDILKNNILTADMKIISEDNQKEIVEFILKMSRRDPTNRPDDFTTIIELLTIK